MGHKKEYEEKQRHGTVELPLGLHKMEYPEGTDAIFYLHWHQEFEFFVVTKGSMLFRVDVENICSAREMVSLSIRINCILPKQ